ncbi:MAG: hypothetical protein JW860_10085 [Sedimentisphaerales bacterium]|nr:hypothetical protein [Sedimentisphaerales bacterium]
MDHKANPAGYQINFLILQNQDVWITSRLILIIFTFLCVCPPVYAQPWSGLGTQAEPFLIEDANDMQAIGAHPEHWDKHFLLTNNIDLSAFDGQDGRDPYNIIGYYESDLDNHPFTGSINGDGHTISNLTYTDNHNSVGLFGYILSDWQWVITYLGLINPQINTGQGNYVGGLVGYLSASCILCSYVEGGSINGGSYVGGMVGLNDLRYGTYMSHATAEVTGVEYIGGLIGYSEDGVVGYCSATGNVYGIEKVGGLVGVNKQGDIFVSYAMGNVTGENLVGGLIGCNENGDIWHASAFVCYANGSVRGDSEVGGLVGYNEGKIGSCYSTGNIDANSTLGIGGFAGVNTGDIYVSFWDIQTSGQTEGVGNDDGEVYGRTTEQMMQQATFVAHPENWHFVDSSMMHDEFTWRMCEDGVDYPRLWWEPPAGDFLCPDRVDMNDFNLLSLCWPQETIYSGPKECELIDIKLAFSEVIDIDDLVIFASNWLSGR